MWFLSRLTSFVLAIAAKEARIGLLEEFFRTALIPAVLSARARDQEGAIGTVRFQMKAVTTSENPSVRFAKGRAPDFSKLAGGRPFLAASAFCHSRLSRRHRIGI
jgi:hypothetical protein